MRQLWVVDLGLMGYRECVNVQAEMHRRRLAGEIEDTLLLLEHKPVITLGTAGGEESLLAHSDDLAAAGIDLVQTDRGGNVTYHGPGQLVGYPIFDLRRHGRDVHAFLRNLELAIIACLGDLGIAGETIPGLTGVWVGGDKICSIGIAVRKWISYHGFALNVNPNFEHWSFIHPCGLADRKVTSLERLLGYLPDMSIVKQRVVDKFAQVFGLEPVQLDPDRLIGTSIGRGIQI